MFERFMARGPKEAVPGFQADAELDQLAVQYTELVQEHIRRALDDPHDTLPVAKEAREEFERLHGDALRAYLNPYMNLPSTYFNMPHEEYPRWYAAAALKRRPSADDEPTMR